MTVPRFVSNSVRGRRGLRRALVAFAGIGAFAFALFWTLDAVMYPWAVSLTTPTLPGEWYGEVIMPSGRKEWLTLHLRADRAGRNGSRRVIGAGAHLCGAHGVRAYDGSTRPENWRGTAFNLALGATDHRDEGLVLIKLSAEWNGADMIRARARFESGGPQTVAIERGGAMTRPSADPDTLFPVALTLRRGGEGDFAAACARMSSSARSSRERRKS